MLRPLIGNDLNFIQADEFIGFSEVFFLNIVGGGTLPIEIFPKYDYDCLKLNEYSAQYSFNQEPQLLQTLCSGIFLWGIGKDSD